MIALFFLIYVAIGGGTGYGAYAFGQLEPLMSGIVGVATTLVLSQIHLFFRRPPVDRSEQIEAKVDALENVAAKTVAKVAEIEGRTDTMETTLKHELTERRDALVSEMKQLESLIERLAITFEQRLVANEQSAPQLIEPKESEALRKVKTALQDGRIDLHLQPIVSLPQRRVAFYEGFTRLRSEDNTLIMPSDFLESARQAKLLGAIDNMTLFRCVQIVRKLAARDRRVGVFCNIASASLQDEAFFPQFLDFMSENRDLSGAVIFEIRADRFETRSRIMKGNMDKLTALGFRFSVDHANSLDLDLPRLQDAGVRFIKISADQLLSDLRNPDGARPISAMNRRLDARDVMAVFARYGITLIVDKLEDEAGVIEVLEYGAPFGQGNVFGAPRPIKASLMEETTPPPEFMSRMGSALH